VADSALLQITAAALSGRQGEDRESSRGATLSFNTRSAAIAALLTLGATAALADPSGLWREKDGGTIRVSRCGAGYCATIASVNPPTDAETGKRRTDKNNPEAAKRNRPLVGVAVLIGMKPNGEHRWSGRLYDSDRGETLNGHLVEVDAKTIRIEGCVMGICGGEELTRVR
jgi:uncharacterized protein (DUF2147 family)